MDQKATSIAGGTQGSSWSTLLTSKLDNNTKLVGPLISCQDVDWPPSMPQAERRHGVPHLPPHMLATDRVSPVTWSFVEQHKIRQ